SIAGLVPCELVCWYDRDPASGELAVTSEPPGALDVGWPGSGEPVVTSGSPGAADLARPARAVRPGARGRPTRVVTLEIPDPGRVAYVSVYRSGRDFDATERALLETARASAATAQRLLARRPVPEDRRELTAREAEVLDALAAGHTPAQ